VEEWDDDTTISNLQQSLKWLYPTAAHIPMIWFAGGGDHDKEGWEEDEEPLNSVGPFVLKEIQRFLRARHSQQQQQQAADKDKKKMDHHPKNSVIVVAIVRFFGEQLLGVTCGRLSQCYQSIAKLALHRHFNGSTTPMEQEILVSTGVNASNVYGLGAGDCELILNLIQETTTTTTNEEDDPENPQNDNHIVNVLRKELNFDGFRGASGEVLPRLQNLQADIIIKSPPINGNNPNKKNKNNRDERIIPVYRYPGNYSGEQWQTFDWSPTSLVIKKAVEEGLKPLVQQTMNHCVANLYQNGADFIGHHSDKDLDLNRSGVIVSVSFGDERVLELKRRAPAPQDVTRIPLPHGSMLVLGPNTNRHFTHSIIPKEGSTNVRISLTLREVKTFLDCSTGRLFGQGVSVSSSSTTTTTTESQALDDVRRIRKTEDKLFVRAGLGVFAGWMAWTLRPRNNHPTTAVTTTITTTSTTNTTLFWGESILMATVCATIPYGLRLYSNFLYRNRQERAARDFFSQLSTSGTKY
jgi:alkylated DNA repair dioxygenase AlkB